MKHDKIIFLVSAAVAILCAAALSGCIFYRGGYSLSGASIPEGAKTFSVAYFPKLVEALKDKFSRQTKLQLVEENGDFAFEGEIVGYTSTTASVSSDDYAILNRLTITVKVKFTNSVVPENSFNRVFTAFTDYDSTQLLTDVQTELDAEIVSQIVTDIFQAAASNW